MHIRTNIELNMVHIVILAICPLLVASTSLNQAMFFILTTFVCFLISAFICFALNKFLSRNIKIFISAMLSTFIVTLINLFAHKLPIFGVGASDINFLAVLSTVVLCVDVYYIDTKAVVNNYLFRVLITILTFAILYFIFEFIKEPLAYGTIFSKKVSDFSGAEFCRTVTFDLLLLGVVALVAEIIYRAVTKAVGDKKIAYQKFVKLVREEKEFQYDTLRRNKLLASDVQTNRVDDEAMKEIIDRTNNNEVGVEEKTEKPETKEVVEESNVKKRKTKKNRRLKFSKEAKVEKIFDKNKKEEDEE